MAKMLIGKKLGMTSVFIDEKAVPATVISLGPCFVSQIKTEKKDGYNAIQLAYGKSKSVNKPQKQHLKKAKLAEDLKSQYEFRTGDTSKFEPGMEIKCDIFETGLSVDATSISKGKGFQGTVKRHNFNTGPKTHGSKNYRKPGSIGATGPQRVLRGKKMAGHMGNQKATIKNLKILEIDIEKNVMILKGAIPGINGSTMVIKDSIPKN